MGHQLGQAIRMARQSQGLTVKALAGRVGVLGPTVSRYESGEVDPSGRVLVALLGALGLTGPQADTWRALWQAEAEARAVAQVRAEAARVDEYLTWAAGHPRSRRPRLAAWLLGGVALLGALAGPASAPACVAAPVADELLFDELGRARRARRDRRRIGRRGGSRPGRLRPARPRVYEPGRR